MPINPEILQVLVECCPDSPTLALAFKLEEGKFGQLTYMRLYQVCLAAARIICWLRLDWCISYRRSRSSNSKPGDCTPLSSSAIVVRFYGQGTISKGDMLFNLNTGKKLKVPRLVRMHSAEMQVRCTRMYRSMCSFGLRCTVFQFLP